MDSGWSEKCLLFPIGFPKGLRQIRAVRGMGNPRLSARCRVVLAEGLPSRPPKSALGSRDCGPEDPVDARCPRWHSTGWHSTELTLSGRAACPQPQVCRDEAAEGEGKGRPRAGGDEAAAARAPSPWARLAPVRGGTQLHRDQDARSCQRPPFGDRPHPQRRERPHGASAASGVPRGEPQLASLSCLSPTPFLLCLSLQISGE